jgi:hypothetical protein
VALISLLNKLYKLQVNLPFSIQSLPTLPVCERQLILLDVNHKGCLPLNLEESPPIFCHLAFFVP